MNFQEYQTLSPRTLAPIGEVYGIDYKAMTFADNQDAVEELAVAAEHSHMALGMTTEIVELVEAIENADETNIGEELADITWYVSGELYLRKKTSNYDFSQICWTEHDTSTEELLLSLTCKISIYSDYTKKFLAYRKDASEKIDMVFSLDSICQLVHMIAYKFDINMEEQLDKNIRKLQKRFPDKFTIDQANNRNLDAERQELES